LSNLSKKIKSVDSIWWVVALLFALISASFAFSNEIRKETNDCIQSQNQKIEKVEKAAISAAAKADINRIEYKTDFIFYTQIKMAQEMGLKIDAKVKDYLNGWQK